jgi:hypothetical protein
MAIRDASAQDTAELEQVFELAQALHDGHSRLCSKCALPLRLVTPGQGSHPGIFCATGCTTIYFDFASVPTSVPLRGPR